MRHHGKLTTGIVTRGARRRPRSRGLAFLALALAGALAVAGCGGGDAEGGDAGGPSTVTVWHYFSTPAQVKVMTDFKKKFEAEHPDATVENVYVPYDQMNSKLINSAGAQSGPDVVVFNGAETSTLALAGVLAPLDDRWAEYADAEQFPDSVIHKSDDSIYSVQGYVNLLGLWYNADLLEEIGVEPPSSLAELEAAMQAAKEAGKGGITLSGLPNSQGEWQAYPWLTSQGFTYENLDEGAIADTFSLVRGWVEDGYLSQQAVSWDQTVPFQKFLAGDIAFAENGNWQLGAAESDAKFEYGVVPLPLGESGKVYLGGEGQGIGAHSDNPDLAWQYLQETYLDREGQLIPLEDVGSLPSRRDTAEHKLVTSNELLAPFAKTISEMGANYPAGVVPGEGVADVQLAMGEAWSAAIGGQQSPEQAASKVMTTLTNVIQ